MGEYSVEAVLNAANVCGGTVGKMLRAYATLLDRQAQWPSGKIASVRETVAGPTLSVYGVEITSWLGTAHDEKARMLADDINHAALQAVAPVQAAQGEAAQHWHGLYRKECLRRQDDATRYGHQILDLEAKIAATPQPPKDTRCPARVIHPKPAPPGPGNAPIWCCLPEEHEGPHRHNGGGGMYPSIPFRETDKVSMEPLTPQPQKVQP